MRTILAIALLTLAACDNLAPATGGYDPIAAGIVGSRMNQPTYQMPTGSQAITLPSGRMVNCTTIGAYTNCY